MEILQICLKSSQIWSFPRIFCSRNKLYLENYLEYFRSEKSAKKYFFQIKCWKYSHGRKGTPGLQKRWEPWEPGSRKVRHFTGRWGCEIKKRSPIHSIHHKFGHFTWQLIFKWFIIKIPFISYAVTLCIFWK